MVPAGWRDYNLRARKNFVQTGPFPAWEFDLTGRYNKKINICVVTLPTKQMTNCYEKKNSHILYYVYQIHTELLYVCQSLRKHLLSLFHS